MLSSAIAPSSVKKSAFTMVPITEGLSWLRICSSCWTLSCVYRTLKRGVLDGGKGAISRPTQGECAKSRCRYRRPTVAYRRKRILHAKNHDVNPYRTRVDIAVVCLCLPGAAVATLFC